jgi:hypothetical protein
MLLDYAGAYLFNVWSDDNVRFSMLFGQSHDLRDRQGFIDLVTVDGEFVSQRIWCMCGEQDEGQFVSASSLNSTSLPHCGQVYRPANLKSIFTSVIVPPHAGHGFDSKSGISSS